MTLEPARLEPVFVPRIWGARSLAPLFPKRNALEEPIGEVWLTGHQCRFATGPFAGRTLGEAWAEMDPAWTGVVPRDTPFPLLVKFLFPETKLSIQVHPDDDYARRHEASAGGRGKTEMWFVISARPGAEAMVGLKPGVTRESFRQALADGTLEDCLEHIPLEPGEAIFVPAGTAHTIGPGSVLCEIQEYSDVTYRVFDYNRLTPEGKPRPLHVEQAFEVIHFGVQSAGKRQAVPVRHGPITETYYIACRYFATEHWEFSERADARTDPEHFDLLIVLAGSGRIKYADGAAAYAPAEAWLLPAALGTYQLAPASPTTLLRTYVPDLDELARRLAERGVEEAARSRLVYR